MRPFPLPVLGAFEPRVVRTTPVAIPLAHLDPGVHQAEDVLFKLAPDGQTVEWVVSRACDHRGGRLHLEDDQACAVCPLHNWTLDTDTLQYRNIAVRKPTLPFEVVGGELRFEVSEKALAIPEPLRPTGQQEVRVRFLAHASVAIEVGDFCLVTDPWLIGPCFANGWWHNPPPKSDALDILRRADLLYISHNHADHMHEETLRYLPPDVPIVVPAFASHSAKRSLATLGFTNVQELSVNSLYPVQDGQIVLSILKSGDFRDDSGLFLATGDFSMLMTVDSNALNHLVLPRDIDLLLTSFAGGASGYPLCFEVLSLEERLEIARTNHRSVATTVLKYVDATHPRYYMPYAGFFAASAQRDQFIEAHNHKNTPHEVNQKVQARRPDVTCVDPLDTDELVFAGGSASIRRVERPPLYAVDSAYIQPRIDTWKARERTGDADVIAHYFRCAAFQDALTVYVVPTDDEFAAGELGVVASLHGAQPGVRIAPAAEVLAAFDAASGTKDDRHLLLKARAEGLAHVLRRGLPLEELMFGFQCRIDRKPNIYNAAFWYHFSNVHIGDLACATRA
jgi:CMP-N-acetylneuraminate monooxygenase